MKTRHIPAMALCGLVLFLIPTIVHAQAPGINFQAVARDDQGKPMSGKALDVTVEILAGQTSDSLVWKESQEVTTNLIGLFTMEICGPESQYQDGAATSPNEINWASGDHFIAITVDNGTSSYTLEKQKINAVPYALSAVSLDTRNPVKSGLVIEGESQSDTDALFEVRRADGQPVFSVFNEGVQVYVDDQSKGIKGGFAVGGYTVDKKGIGQEFLRVTKDSTRIFFDENAKGIKGGFAVGGYVSSKGNSRLMTLEPNNYLVGHSAGINLTGSYNQFFGYEAGMLTSTGNYNVYMGHQAGRSNDEGESNVTIGYRAGYSGDGNTNILMGYRAGYRTDSEKSIMIGPDAGFNSEGGKSNIFIGYQAGYNTYHPGLSFSPTSDQGTNNVFIGTEAGEANSSGFNNIFFGTQAGNSNTRGYNNIMIGPYAGLHSEEGDYNVFIGRYSGYSNSGYSNVIIGQDAGLCGYDEAKAEYNSCVFIGTSAGSDHRTGNNNTFIGAGSGWLNENGYGNVFVGNLAGHGETGSNKLYISNSSTAEPLIYGDFSSPYVEIHGDMNVDNGSFRLRDNPGTAASPEFYVYQGLTGSTDKQYAFTVHDYLWVTSGAEFDGSIVVNSTTYASDARYKKDIIPIAGAMALLEQLEGVWFNWRQDEFSHKKFSDHRDIGFIAQDVEKVLPGLVSTGSDGYKSVDYARVTSLLVEAVKEQKKENDMLKTRLSDMEARIMALESLLAD